MIVRARTLLTLTGPPIDDGAVWIREGCIAAAGSYSEVAGAATGSPDTVDLGEQILLPGLINAHCHLDYTMMRRAILPQPTFTRWIERINALKRSFTETDYLRAIEQGFAELIQWGTTSVLNIEAFPELLLRLPPPPIRTWWFYEIIDLRKRVDIGDALIAGALQFFNDESPWLGGFGLSPHAPYTASEEIHRLAQACGSVRGMPLTTHLAESAEEWRMFFDGAGPLHDFLKRLGRPMEDCGGLSPIRWFLNAGLDPTQWLLVHLNEISDGDFQALGNRVAHMSVVHCPMSHRYFQHRDFRASELSLRGANLCLGTDSLASAPSLSLFSEMRQFARTHPNFSPSAILRMTTTNPARALGAAAKIGSLQPGAHADMIALRDNGKDSPYEQVIAYQNPIPWMMVGGKLLVS